MNRFFLPSDRQRWIVPAIAIFAFAIRAAPLFRSLDAWAMDNDSSRYVELADGLRAGCGFAKDLATGCAAAEVLRTPGYPLFLAAMPSLKAALFVQAIIGALACLVAGLTTAKFWGIRAGATAAILLALDVPSIVNGDRVMSDGLFQGLVTAAICLELIAIGRGQSDREGIMLIVGAAVISGAAILVRPIGLSLPIFAGAAALIASSGDWRRRAAIAIVAAAIPGLVTAGWVARNRVRSGVWTISTDGALALYYFGAAGVVWNRTGLQFPVVQRELANEIGERFENYPDTPPSKQHKMITHSIGIYANDPIGAAAVTARSLAWLLWIPDRANLAPFIETSGGAKRLEVATSDVPTRLRDLLSSPVLTLLVGLQSVLMLVTWAGIAIAFIKIRRKAGREKMMIAFLLVAAMLMILPAALPAAMSRYRIPAVPLFAMLSGIGYFGKFSIFTPLDSV
ncbi:MAG: hypothetical protein Q7S58_04270 [Candidatus Binatus sp.]|nr:hypothetical protein [Candidatus Binatus sp.]